MNFLTENQIEQNSDLERRIEEVTSTSEQTADALKGIEKWLSDMVLLIKNISDEASQ